MSYRRALVTNWSRRDRLAVLVLATVTALLVGTTLSVIAASGETTRVAADQLNESADVTTYADPTAARDAAGADGVVFPYATAEEGDRTVTVVGVPQTRNGSALRTAPPPNATTVRGPADPGGRVELHGDADSVTRSVVAPGTRGLFPEWWYVATPSTVDQLGPTGAFVVGADTPADGSSGAAARGTVPLVGGLVFFLRGTEQLLQSLLVVTGGAALLTAVVVFSITRMTVRDRLTTLVVLRATGLERHRVLWLFTARATLLTAVAVLAGTAAGIVLPNAAVNAAVSVGVSTTLTLGVSGRVLRVLGPLIGGVLGAGTLAGAIATLSAVRASPAALAGHADGASTGGRGSRGDGPLARFRPRLLPSNALVPTAATLTVFAAVAVVAVTALSVVAPVTATSADVVMQEGAAHPWSSRVDADYADALRSGGNRASPEIFLLSVVDGTPFLARGADFGAYANVSDATLVDGRRPRTPDEAVIGRGLARTLGVSPGERLTLGGTNRPGIARVDIVGTYRAAGLYDDQLIVPLATARHLSNVGEGDVNLIRTSATQTGTTESPSPAGTPVSTLSADGIRVTALSVPASVTVNESIPVTVTLDNDGRETASRTLTIGLGNASVTRDVRLAAGERTTVTVDFDRRPPGRYAVSAGDRTRTVTVGEQRYLSLGPLPDRGPPGATLRVRVTNGTGNPVGNATLTIGDTTVQTDGSGVATLALPAADTATITATAPGYEATRREISVSRTATRLPVARLTVTPRLPGPLERPRATVDLRNPWNTTVDSDVAVSRSVGRPVPVEVGAGERTNVTATLHRAQTGVHRVEATVDGAVIAQATYEVRGDDRILSALGSGEGTTVTGSGLNQATTAVLGNVSVLLGTLVGLAALATVAATTVSFSRAVHARRRTIGVHRATGATPLQVSRRVLTDAARIALPAAGLALLCAMAAVWLLARTDVLVAFGIALVPAVTPGDLAAIAAVTVALAVLGAAVATWGLVRVEPARLLDPPDASSGDDRRPPREDEDA